MHTVMLSRRALLFLLFLTASACNSPAPARPSGPSEQSFEGGLVSMDEAGREVVVQMYYEVSKQGRMGPSGRKGKAANMEFTLRYLQKGASSEPVAEQSLVTDDAGRLTARIPPEVLEMGTAGLDCEIRAVGKGDLGTASVDFGRRKPILTSDQLARMYMRMEDER